MFQQDGMLESGNDYVQYRDNIKLNRARYTRVV